MPSLSLVAVMIFKRVKVPVPEAARETAVNVVARLAGAVWTAFAEMTVAMAATVVGMGAAMAVVKVQAKTKCKAPSMTRFHMLPSTRSRVPDGWPEIADG